MSKRIVISFPGGRGYEIPLLYFGAKYYEDLGYEKLLISHLDLEDYSFESILNNAEKIISRIDFGEYADIVFLCKSIGTEVACILKEKYHIPAKLLLFTPIEETLPFIRKDNRILLVAMGDKDRYIDATKVKTLCDAENIRCYVEPGVGHRMEVMNDLKRNLEIIENIIGCL